MKAFARLLIIAALMIPLWQASAMADGLSQDEVLRLLERGEIQPLQQLLERHAEHLKGRLIDLELEYEHGQLVYELELIDADGRVREYLIDARTGQWLGEDD